MDLLESISTVVPENIKALTGDTSLRTCELHKGEVKRTGIRKSPRKKFHEKETLNSLSHRSTPQRSKYLNTNNTAKTLRCHEDLDAKNEPSDKSLVSSVSLSSSCSTTPNRKRTKDWYAEQESTFCKKSRTPKTQSHSNIATEKHMSEKHTDTCRSKETKGSKNRLNGTFVKTSDRSDARKYKTSGQDGHSCEQKRRSRIMPHSSISTEEYKCGISKGTKIGIRRKMCIENERRCVFSPDSVNDTRKGMLCHEETFEPKNVHHSWATTDYPKSLKRKCLVTENKEYCPMSDPNENNTEKAKPHYNHRASSPEKKGRVQAATRALRGGPSDSEQHAKTKGKFNQFPLPDFSFGAETDLFSSDLSLGCSSPEYNAVQELWPNDDTEEDVHLPVLNLHKEPPSFERADFVWCKFQRYPYWPSLVMSVRSKEKKATIIFVEECLSDPNSKKKSFQVGIRTLKHYDCPEKQELLGICRKGYGKSIDWCDALICDYRIRLGCGSFSGAFLEYCTAAISYPVRRECSNIKLHFPSLSSNDSPTHIPDRDSQLNKKLLPDRSRASRDKANEKLVEYIVKVQQVETHLTDILKGNKNSTWLKKFQSLNHGVDCLETYLENEEQIEMVVNYLYTLCDKMHRESKKLMNGDQAKFILEVMLPEAVIFAIAATNDISYAKAEEQFLEGPLLSKRERKLFEKQILKKKATKHPENSCSETYSS